MGLLDRWLLSLLRKKDGETQDRLVRSELAMANGQLKPSLLRSPTKQITINEIKEWLEEFERKNLNKRMFCISIGKETAADIQLIHPEVYSVEPISPLNKTGYLIHLAFDQNDAQMKERHRKFLQIQGFPEYKKYFTEDGIPCYFKECGKNKELIVNSIRELDKIIQSNAEKYQIDFWFYDGMK